MSDYSEEEKKHLFVKYEERRRSLDKEEDSIIALQFELDLQIPLLLKYKVIRDIARGMSFLHNIKPPVVHRDLRSPNVFVLN